MRPHMRSHFRVQKTLTKIAGMCVQRPFCSVEPRRPAGEYPFKVRAVWNHQGLGLPAATSAFIVGYSLLSPWNIIVLTWIPTAAKCSFHPTPFSWIIANSITYIPPRFDFFPPKAA